MVGATYPAELARARELCPDMTFLVPGVGAQGGDVETVVANGLDAHGRGLLINASRSVIFADDPGARPGPCATPSAERSRVPHGSSYPTRSRITAWR